jgi:hypothetical protein
MRLFLFGLSIAAISLDALADNSLFGESASPGELDAIRRQGEAAEAALVALDELQKLS